MRNIHEGLMKEYNLTKRTIIGKKFESVVNGNTYYTHNVAIDTDTKELRVVYSNGIDDNHYVTTLSNFIRRFNQLN